MASFPCTDETPLRLLNDYPPTETADLFRSELRFEIMAVAEAKVLIEENVPPHEGSWRYHEAVRTRAKEHGLHSTVAYLDAASVGAATSRTRWFSFLSVTPLPPTIDLAALSKLSDYIGACSRLPVSIREYPDSLVDLRSERRFWFHGHEFHSTNWHAKNNPALTSLRAAMRDHAYPTAAKLWPHLHEQICVLALSLPSPMSLGLDSSGHSLTPELAQHA